MVRTGGREEARWGGWEVMMVLWVGGEENVVCYRRRGTGHVTFYEQPCADGARDEDLIPRDVR